MVVVVEVEETLKMVMENNTYAAQFFANNPDMPRFAQTRTWKDVTEEEMEKCIGLTMLTGEQFIYHHHITIHITRILV